MYDDFEIREETIRSFRNVDEFKIWLWATDDVIEFSNIDQLIYLLIHMELPEYVMEALDFRNKYLK